MAAVTTWTTSNQFNIPEKEDKAVSETGKGVIGVLEEGCGMDMTSHTCMTFSKNIKNNNDKKQNLEKGKKNHTTVSAHRKNYNTLQGSTWQKDREGPY